MIINTKLDWGTMKKNLKIIVIILMISAFFLVMNKLSQEAESIRDDCFYAYRPGIEVIKSLNGTEYINYIQRIYVDPGEKNKLMILIKPNYWVMLSEKDKKIILERITEKWKKIYAKSKPKDDKSTPEVFFANI